MPPKAFSFWYQNRVEPFPSALWQRLQKQPYRNFRNFACPRTRAPTELQNLLYPSAVNGAPLTQLPVNLTVPEDDGACSHLLGSHIPDLSLFSTSGYHIDLRHRQGLTVLYVYPLTARPGVPLPNGWDEIPGARGCTPESCAFRDHHTEIRQLGAEVFGLSTQSTDYQREVCERLHLTFELLSDEAFTFTEALSLPTFTVASMRLLRRVTIISNSGVIKRVFYSIFPPDRHPADVVSYLKTRNA